MPTLSVHRWHHFWSKISEQSAWTHVKSASFLKVTISTRVVNRLQSQTVTVSPSGSMCIFMCACVKSEYWAGCPGKRHINSIGNEVVMMCMHKIGDINSTCMHFEQKKQYKKLKESQIIQGISCE